jgi:uncharacterized membrane protein
LLDKSAKQRQRVRGEFLPVTLLFALLLGVFVGLRCLTPPAVVCSAAYLGSIDLRHSPLHLLASKPAVALFTLAALGELIADKLPASPNRTAPLGLGARVAFGLLCGAAIAIAGHQQAWLGALLGLGGSLAGCFAGFEARVRSVKALKCPDFVIALVEDAVAIGGALFVVTRF